MEMKNNTLEAIEARFKEITGLTQEIGHWPLDPNLENISIGELTKSPHFFQFKIRKDLSKSNGEVFTPLLLVDKMLLISNPMATGFNLDLCAGRGQFTIRMLRMFKELDPHFNHLEYLKEKHWFNEMNIESCKELIYIFGEEINLVCGPAQELKKFFEKEECKGIWKYKKIWSKGLESGSELF